MELKGKKLVDNVSSPIFKTRFSGFESSLKENTSLTNSFQEMSESLKQIKIEIHNLQEKSNELYLTLSLISFSILLQCFILFKIGFRR
ncbi:hypothetical protein LEP1GSC052_0060 [Leptospira kmetyi serovar Malaysia str. Bejo-Iso9]|nr:hypothetical protein LEP1GSC052_0060 [Leptospira kmetyi serovar Malaysia str. Bejo-Iso9]